MLYASGIIGQERSMPGLALHHDASCARSSISSVAASASAAAAASASTPASLTCRAKAGADPAAC
mgnify:CR=1 FL=1